VGEPHHSLEVAGSWNERSRDVGMIPSEYSSGDRQRFGKLTKQGNRFLRFPWCEAAMHAMRRDAAFRRFYRRKLQQKGLGKARVAAARKLGIRLWILLRDQIDYAEFCRRASSLVTTRCCLMRECLPGQVEPDP
jgi:hypothetical protein